VQVVCERCTTAYDFPETNVPGGGVTVKCAGCGHRFRVVRVRRKTIPVMVPPAAGPVPPGEGPWTIRTARGETFPLPDVGLLRGWIMERKVTRDDELANAAGLWRKLGSIPEYAGAFVEVDRAMASQRVTPAIRTLDEFTAHAAPGKRPATIELKIPIDGFKQPPPAPSPRTPPPKAAPRPALKAPQPVEEDALEAQPVRRTKWILLGGALLVIAGLAVAAPRFAPKLLHRGPGQAYLQARALFLLDADADLARAEEAFLAVTGADEALAKAALAEVRATRAHYKLLEADDLERSGKTAPAAERKREATAEADQAKRDAEAAGEPGPAMSRALADALRVAGAPAAQVEQVLSVVRASLPNDPESLYVEGALRLREGKRVVARQLLEEATQRFEAATQRPLLRADYLLARIHMEDKNLEEAKARLYRILGANPKHARARHLIESVGSGQAPPPAPGGAAPAAPPPPAPDAAPAPAASEPQGASFVIDKAIRNDYGALVAEADRVAEEGRSARAAKLYERALDLQPRGVEALTGLGYCYMDEEKYPLALATFKRVLAANPRHGEAVIGMAEGNRLKGNPKAALEFYRRYLAEHPGGPKAGMAQNNVRDLEWKYGAKPAPAPPAPQEGAPTTP